MDTGKALHAGVTRRVLLVAGGLTVLAACTHDPLRVARTAQAGAPQAGAAPHPAPAPHPGPAHSTRPPAGARPAPARPRASSPPVHAELARKDRTWRGRRGDAGGLPVTHVQDGLRRIALTIDDGPSPVYTPQVLRLLDRYRVTATFSMIGLEAAAYRGVAREVAAAGHVIANHTWSHPDLAFLPPAAIADQIDRATGAIHQATGRVPTLFRAPYGAWSPAVLEHCARTGMTPLGWSVDPRDWSRPGVAAIVGNIMSNTRTGSIILEHDGGGNRSQTVAALEIVLPRLLAEGYYFTTP